MQSRWAAVPPGRGHGGLEDLLRTGVDDTPPGVKEVTGGCPWDLQGPWLCPRRSGSASPVTGGTQTFAACSVVRFCFTGRIGLGIEAGTG